MYYHLEKIIELDSFKNILKTIKDKNIKAGENIETSLRSKIEKHHQVLEDENSTIQEIKVALLNEFIILKDYKSEIENFCNNNLSRQNELLKFVIEVNESFFDQLYEKVDIYFYNKKLKIFKEIDINSKWHTGIVDSSRKGLSMINRGLNKEVFYDKTLVEDILEKHLGKDELAKEISKIFQDSMDDYEKQWQKKTQDLSKVLKHDYSLMAINHSYNLNYKFEMGIAEQTFLTGISSALAGSLGLAAGWHTITYAMMNVFPPVAIFTVIASIVTGIATQDAATEKRKKQVEEIIKQYDRYLTAQIETGTFKELDDLTIRKYIVTKSKEIVENLLKKFDDIFLAGLDYNDYEKIKEAIINHLELIDTVLYALS